MIVRGEPFGDFGWLAGLTAQITLVWDRVKVCFTKRLEFHMNIAPLPPDSLQAKRNDVLGAIFLT